MAKAKSKELPHFSELLKIISKHQKNFDSTSKVGGWRNDVEVLNSLVGVLVDNTYVELEEWWAGKGGYSSTETTNFKKVDNKKRRKFIPSKIWKYYAGEMLESENLSYNDHIEKIESKINSLDKKPHFLTGKFCEEMYMYFKEYSNVSSIGDMDLGSLEKNMRSKNHVRFLAEVLFFVVADMPESGKPRFSSREILDNKKTFLDEIFEDLDGGKYYDYYKRTMVIEPRIEEGKYICETTLEFSSPLLNRSNPELVILIFLSPFRQKNKEMSMKSFL